MIAFEAGLRHVTPERIPGPTCVCQLDKVSMIIYASTSGLPPFCFLSFRGSQRSACLRESADRNAGKQNRLRRDDAVCFASVRDDKLDATDPPEQDQHYLL